MPFDIWTRVGPRKHVLDAHWHHLRILSDATFLSNYSLGGLNVSAVTKICFHLFLFIFCCFMLTTPAFLSFVRSGLGTSREGFPWSEFAGEISPCPSRRIYKSKYWPADEKLASSVKMSPMSSKAHHKSRKHNGTTNSTEGTVWVKKKGATLYMAITLSILDRFAKFFHCCKEQ